MQDELCVRCEWIREKNVQLFAKRSRSAFWKFGERLTQLRNRKRWPVKSWKWFVQIEELNPNIARRIQYESRSVRLCAQSTLAYLSQSFPIFYLSALNTLCMSSSLPPFPLVAWKTSSWFKILVQKNLSKFFSH